jgi:hypothetical protein
MHNKFWLEVPKGRDNLEDRSIRWENNIKMNLMETGFQGVD